MKPLHEIAPWKVVSVGFGLGVFLMLAGLAFGLMLTARIRAGTLGSWGLLLIASALGVAFATPALSITAMEWLRNRRRQE